MRTFLLHRFVCELFSNLRVAVVAPAFVCVLLFTQYAFSATLGSIYVTSMDPFFAEIPVCGVGTQTLSVDIATDEPLQNREKQPFTDSLLSTLDVYDGSEGLITLTAQRLSPSSVSLIVSLVDSNGVIVDSNIYTELRKEQSPPTNFGCEPIIVEKSDEKEEFFIDVVQGDTWRNLAKTINVAWYEQTFSIERVMVALFFFNVKEDLVANKIHKLPARLSIPDKENVRSIDVSMVNLAGRLDYRGILKVTKKPAKLSQEMLQLQKQLQQLKAQIDALSEQLQDSQELTALRNEEIRTLKFDLVETRQRIADLERRNEELEKRPLFDTLKEHARKNPVLWAGVAVLVFFMILWIMLGHARRRQTEEILRFQKKKILTGNNEKKPVPPPKPAKKSLLKTKTSVAKNPVNQVKKEPVTLKPQQKAKPVANRTTLPVVPVIEESERQKVEDNAKPLTEEDSFDEARSLLDLAVAYINMGDKEEARHTLNKAIHLGDAEIQHEAKEHLAKL